MQPQNQEQPQADLTLQIARARKSETRYNMLGIACFAGLPCVFLGASAAALLAAIPYSLPAIFIAGSLGILPWLKISMFFFNRNCSARERKEILIGEHVQQMRLELARALQSPELGVLPLDAAATSFSKAQLYNSLTERAFYHYWEKLEKNGTPAERLPDDARKCANQFCQKLYWPDIDSGKAAMMAEAIGVLCERSQR